MDFHFEILKQTRLHMLFIIDKHSKEELLRIPKGFNNHLLWNFGHAIVVQHLLVYALSGLEPPIDKALVERFRKGSSPGTECSDELLDQLKFLALSSVTTLQENYDKAIFKNYKEYTTGYNVTLNSATEAIVFNNAHEALHMGYMMSMSRALSAE